MQWCIVEQCVWCVVGYLVECQCGQLLGIVRAYVVDICMIDMIGMQVVLELGECFGGECEILCVVCKIEIVDCVC